MPNTISENELFAITKGTGVAATMTTTTTTMATYNDLFTHHEISGNIITYYGKEEANDANWEKINTFLEEMWGDNGKNKHYKWRGFKIDGKFQTVFVKKPCSPDICDCDEDSDEQDE